MFVCYVVEMRLMGLVSADTGNGNSGSPTMRRRLVIWAQRHRRSLTVVIYFLLLSVLAVLALVPSYLDAVLAPLLGGGSVAPVTDSGLDQPLDVVATKSPPTAVVRKVFDLPFVPQRDFLCDEMHLKVSNTSEPSTLFHAVVHLREIQHLQQLGCNGRLPVAGSAY